MHTVNNLLYCSYGQTFHDRMKKRKLNMTRIKKSNLYVGQLVVVTDHPETQVYTIAEINGNIAILQWYEGDRHCSQGHDAFGFLIPTLKQIEYSIAHNGRLMPVCDLLEWA